MPRPQDKLILYQWWGAAIPIPGFKPVSSSHPQWERTYILQVSCWKMGMLLIRACLKIFRHFRTWVWEVEITVRLLVRWSREDGKQSPCLECPHADESNSLTPQKAYSINIASFKTICRKVRLSMRNFKPLRLLLDNLSLNFSKTIGEKHNELMNSNKSPWQHVTSLKFYQHSS